MKAKEELFTGDKISLKNIAEHHTLFLFTLQCYASQQQTDIIVTFPMQKSLLEFTNIYRCTYIALLLICNAQCGSGLQDQQTEPVQIYCMQLH